MSSVRVAIRSYVRRRKRFTVDAGVIGYLNHTLSLLNILPIMITPTYYGLNAVKPFWLA